MRGFLKIFYTFLCYWFFFCSSKTGIQDLKKSISILKTEKRTIWLLPLVVLRLQEIIRKGWLYKYCRKGWMLIWRGCRVVKRNYKPHAYFLSEKKYPVCFWSRLKFYFCTYFCFKAKILILYMRKVRIFLTFISILHKKYYTLNCMY